MQEVHMYKFYVYIYKRAQMYLNWQGASDCYHYAVGAGIKQDGKWTLVYFNFPWRIKQVFIFLHTGSQAEGSGV